MLRDFNPELDLTLTRIIRAPRARVWNAWAEPQKFERWWVPAPAKAKVDRMELRPGGALETLISEDGKPFAPHVRGCFLAVDPFERIVFTDALLGGWRPAEQSLITAIITFADHPDGTEYVSHVKHRSQADRAMHEKMGFYDGWGTVAAQMAAIVEAEG